MKRKTKMTVLILLLSLGLTGCKKDAPAEEYAGSNIVEIKRDGSVVNTITESFDEALYDKELLEEFTLKEAAQYNHANKEGALGIKKMEAEKGTASITMEYRTAEDFGQFNEYPFFCGTVAEALEKGYDFSGVELEEAGSRADDAETGCIGEDELLEMGSRKILIASVPEEESLQIKTSGKILYISGAVWEKKNLAAIEGGADQPAYIVFK